MDKFIECADKNENYNKKSRNFHWLMLGREEPEQNLIDCYHFYNEVQYTYKNEKLQRITWKLLLMPIGGRRAEQLIYNLLSFLQ